jgi:carboxyl-terminal processing protease
MTGVRIGIALAVVLVVAAFALGLGLGRDIERQAARADPTAQPSPSASPVPEPTPVIETVSCAEPSEAFAILCETYARIKTDYVDEVSDEDLVEGAINGMLRDGLRDPYSGYLPPDEYSSALDDLSGEFSGIGAEVGLRNVEEQGADDECIVITNACVLVIVAPLDGSPAEAAGLRSGDVVLEVDGESTTGETPASLISQVRGEPGTDVTLTVERAGTELDITITRAVIELTEVSFELLADGVGYVRLTSFTDRAGGFLRDALGSLLDQGATSLVLDLRDNPGGYVQAAQEIASQFIPSGELLFTVESGGEARRWEALPGGLLQDGSVAVAVLINGGSASASEILAAALSETGRATLVGEPTFGKNTVQVWTELPNGGGLRLTTDRWFTPAHASAADGGIAPHVEVPAPEEPVDGVDPQLDRAVDLLTD